MIRDNSNNMLSDARATGREGWNFGEQCVRFEQKGLISLSNLIRLALAMRYVSEIKNLFAQPKYETMGWALDGKVSSYSCQIT